MGKVKTATATVVVIWAFAVLSAARASDNGTQTPPAETPQSNSAVNVPGYVGSDVCQTCHADEYHSWEKSPHWKTTLDTKGGPAHQGCEGCHGPGEAHVAGGGDKTKIFIFKDHTAKEIADRCLTCHASSTEHMHALNSVHTQNSVSCISCHSPHHSQTKEFLLTKAQPELCYTCHASKRAEFAMPFHHRVDQGLVQCSDCHNVHGTEGPKQLRMASTQDEVCYKCHTDKQGPFVYEHAPIKVNGCESCHMVHGGPNPHMLKASNMNLLCLSCHTTSSFSSAPGAPSFHNQASLFQACTLCHVAIHGSNFSSFYFK